MSSGKKVLSKETIVKMSKVEHVDVNAPATAVEFDELQCGIKGFQLSGETVDEIESTALCDTHKQYENGLIDPGEMSFDAFYTPGKSGYDALVAAVDDRTKRLFVFIFADGSAMKVVGFVKSESLDIPLGGVVGSSIVVRLSGAIVRGKAADILTATKP